MLIRSQQQQQQQHQHQHQQHQHQNLTSGSCSPVPGNIAPILSSTEDNDIYLLNNPYDYRNNSNRTTPAYNDSSYHLYDNHHNGGGTSDNTNYSSPYENATSPYVQQRKLHHSVIDHIDKEPYHTERRNSIDLPTSPPPESLKYTTSASSSVWPDSTSTATTPRLNDLVDNTSSASSAAVDRKASPLGIF